MTLKVTDETNDVRGRIVWLASENKEIHLVEVKKGYARGGHYHPFPSTHFIASGRVIYRENDLNGNERERVFESNSIITTPANIAHIMIALEDTIFMEIFDLPYRATIFPLFRKIVEENMNSPKAQA